MPKDNESTKWLYKQLKKKGYDVGKDAAEFDNLMRTNKSSREWAYKTARSNGLNVGKDQSEFDNLVAPKTPASTGNHAQQVVDEYDASERQNGDTAKPTQNTQVAKPQKPWKPTMQETLRMNANLYNIGRSAQQTMDDFNERMDNLQEYGRSFAGGHTASGGLRFNPQSKKMERTYLTPTGERTFNKAAADAVSREYRDAVDMTVGGQIRRAQNRLQELKDKAAARVQELHEKWKQDYENNDAPLAAVLAADTYVPSIQSDQTYRALQAAIRQTEEQIKTLGEQQDRDNGVDVGFWRGFGRVAGDIRTWDFGIGDMMDAMTMMNAADPKRPQTEQEKAANQEMLRAIHENQRTEAMYGGNASFWNRAGMMTGYMPSFMLDFAMTGGGYDAINVATKAAGKAATKALGKEAVKNMAEQGFKTYIKNNGLKGLGQEAANWTIKALGTTTDELLIRAPLMTNTVQAGDTAADIINRKLGDVTVDENGNYDFTNDKTWGSAIWQGEANSIVENYSEMFGTHLPEVASLKNLGKLANVIGAKRLSGVLSRANAGALGGITDTTRRIFGQMGVSDYLGEVSEEYYGQLWRTMLNLDDAYQQNADGTRTNLFATKQFHGDIWGGMALSMGLMGAGKTTMSAAGYLSMKHDVNKADAMASELLTPDVWEPLRSVIDMATNDNVGDVAERIVSDKELTNEEKAAVLNYMERSLYLRGANLAELVKSRGGEQDENTQRANDSYIDGYNAATDEEKQNAKNMYDLQRQKAEQILSPETLAEIDNDPMGALQQLGDDEEANHAIIDYINAKQVYNGMIQRVRDDIDSRIEQSNTMIDSRVNRATGAIQGVTMKVQDDEGKDRRAYVLEGNLVMLDDGTGIDHDNSDESIVIRDAATGAIEMVSPDAILSMEQPVDPELEKQTAAEAIRQQFAQEAANKIDGTVAFQPGDTYTVTDESGQAAQIQIVPNADGLADNGDGTVNVSSDGGQTVVPMRKDDIQAMVDATNRARVAQVEQQREAMQQPQAQEQPAYSLNDELTLLDENGNEVRGSITADANEDGQYEVYTENPINGRKVNLFTAEELNNLNANTAENSQQNGGNLTENGGNSAENLQQEQQPVQAEQPGQSAMERIPKDEQAQPVYEQADPDTAWDAIVEQAEGDESMAQIVADSMVADKEAELKKVEKTKSKGGTTIAEKIAAERERKNAVEQAKATLAHWQKIAQTAERRRQVAMAEQARAAAETARLRREQEETERAEREEADRIRREALNGVPDIIDDKPQDARARGFRRVNGEKVDRQQPLQAKHGKEVQVKFDDKNIPAGRVSLIEAEQLQPSHVNGRRNPLHFIDEAQPKERNDEASVISARNIAANIRPEEITSSVTAYTGAPTVNARGEVIQGNNRSAALREMWAGQPEQAAKYKQYLAAHAADFGLTPEDVEAMQHPVLVNMIDVADDDAITLGQFVAQDTESGGVERIKPKNIVQKMGGNMRSYANLLLKSTDDEMSFAELVDRNGMDVLKWMQQKGYITSTQYKSAFDSKGNLTAEAKNDLKGIMYQSIFQNGNTHLEEMFGALPVKAQKAILATAYRDYDSPNAERLNAEIQNSISAYYALSQNADFANAKNYKEARLAVEAWKRQYALDDVTGESYLPSDKYSNFALLLATMYKGQTQTFIQNTFNHIYDLVQGTQEETLFETPDNTPRTLVAAINEAINSVRSELLINEQFTYDNEQRRSNVLAGNSTAGQQGGQGSPGSLETGERVENGDATADRSGGTESDSREEELASRVEVSDDDWQEGDAEKPTYKRSIIIDGKYTATQIDQPDEGGHYTGSYFEFDNKRFGDIAEIIDYIDNGNTLSSKISEEEAKVNVNPTEAQKEAGNYKKGHVRIGQFDVSIEQPKGSVRSGVDASGNKWETTMQNTYGYIRGTEGVDGDHIDVFLTNDIDGWNGRRVYIVDQYNDDGTFDEHKVMLGFNDEADAQDAYLSNYEKGWENKRKLVMTSVNLPDFEKWINSSHRKTKPFAEYQSVNGEQKTISPADRATEITNRMSELKKQADEAHGRSDIFEEARLIAESNELYAELRRLQQPSKTTDAMSKPANVEQAQNELETEQQPVQTDGYTVERRYHKKNGTYINAVKFTEQMPRERFLELKKRVKDFGGYYSSFGKGGFIFETEEDGKKFAEAVLDPSSEKLDDNKPLSLSDMQQSSEPVMRQVDVEGLMQAISQNGEAKLSDHFVVGRPGLTEKATSRQSDNTAQETGQQPQQSDNNGYGANNKLVSRDRYEELKKRMRQKLGGQLNMGIDPEILAIGTEMAAYHIEAGARKFADYARHMIDDLGDAIRPYLKSFYNGVRDLPEVQEAGYVDEMTPYDEVRTFDVANFDKGQGNAMATAEMVVAEQEANRQADAAKEQLTNQRNEQRRQEDEQRTADTEAVADEAETTAREAESRIEAATDEKEVNEAVRKVDEQLDKVNRQLALLGYYEAEPVESDFNEAYGYMRNAEKKAVKDANNLAKRLVNDLGIDPKTIVDKKGKRRRSIATANIAPIGGDISIHLPLGEKRELYISIQLDNQDGDNLKVTGGMLRIENPNPERGEERYLSSNNFFAEDETYPSLLGTAQRLVKHYAPDFVPVGNTQQEASTKSEEKPAKRQKKQQEPKIADLFSGQEETVSESQEDMPFKKGDNVIYKGKPATVYDIEGGQLVLDTGLAPVLYESVNPKEVQRASGKQVSSVDKKQAVSSQVKQDIKPTEQKQEDELSGNSADYQKRAIDEKNFVGEIAGEISYIASQMQYGGEYTPLTMVRVKKMLDKYDTLHDLSTTDIQELVELAMTRLTRLAAQGPLNSPNASFQRKGYENVVALYNAQPMLNARDSTRVERQQYSTPTPFGYVMGQFVRAGRNVESVLEPSAGNGALTIAFDPSIVHVNDIDDRRLANLRTLEYGQVTGQNALLPFEGEQVDAMLTNPPFGSTTEKVYDDIFKISSLEGQMAINAIDTMKDNGRAAIVIGGNTEYRENGVMKPKDMQFFGYLYSHYNVVDVINMDGEMYARNGTKYPVRIILINGRKTGAFQRVIPPVKSKARAEKVTTFDELYNRVQDDILQLQQMGSETAGSNGEATATDRGTREQDSRTNNQSNAGNGNEPLRSGERSRRTQPNRDTSRTEHAGRAGSTNEQSTAARVDNGNRGNARGTDDVPQQPSATKDEQSSRNVADEPRRSGGTEHSDTTPQSSANGGRLAVSLTDEKVPYPNRSQAATLMSVVPANQAQVLAASLADIGDVDQFLVDRLGYSSKEELFSYLAAEQIDSVALAINQMSKGNGFIIGDMTGVGKGRQGAALIRYAVRQGKKPIYFTQKPALFADNYRDLCDIGSSDLRPFVIASSKDGVITDAKGNVVYKLPTKKEVQRVFDYIMQNGTLPDEYDYAITTYSQIQNGTKEYEVRNDEITEKDKSYKGKTPAGDVSGQERRNIIEALANDNYLILDESHTVGGQGGGSMFMQYLMPKISGVTFLSATFAKRPDNMPLYAMKTALSESGMKPQEMIEAIAKGGVTLQEIMSKQLVQSGQMIRRERSFQGVNIDWLPVTEEADKIQRAQFDEVADIFNSIRSFQDDYIKPLVTQMSDDLAEQGSYSDLRRGTEAMGVRNTPFASKMYNLVNQLLFALKADAVADRAIWNLKHGFKPVISFTNTMEGFLEEAPKDTPMDEIPNFSLTLLRALDGVMRYQVTDADNKTTGNSFRLSELSPEGQAKYNEIRNRIMNLSANLPISPMDTIKMKIEEAGYTVGEITGRTTELVKDENGKYVVRNRTDKDKKAAARDFNNGKLDVLMINKSGSTGISLHSSPKFGDQRQRVMVFAQFQQDINDEVQMRGRIDRTGQVYRGRYEYIVSSIPAEQRLQMMFKAKLKSLDANTTSSQKSKFNEMQVVDYLNKYGDEVTWQYMQEHPELSERLGDPLKMLSGNESEEEPRNSRAGETAKPQDGCAAKIARYLPFLPVAEQERVFKDITEAYQVKIQLLNDAGENDLEITTMPLRAETKKRSIWRRGTAPNSGNAFADNTYLEEVEVDVLKKPMKANEIKAMASRLTDGKDFEQWRTEMHNNISNYYDQKATALQKKLEAKANERAEKQKEKYIKNAKKARQDGKNMMTDEEITQMAQEAATNVISDAREKAAKQVEAIVRRKNDIEEVLDMFIPLQPLVIPLDLREDAIQTTFTPSYGTFVGFKFSKEYSPSTSTAIFATLDGRRKVELPLRSEKVFSGIRMQSTMNSYTLRDINMDNWDSRVPTKSRRTAYIVTGNLLQALVDTEKDAKTKGYLISYSTIDGDTRQGILMPERFQPNDLRSSVPISSRLHQIRSGEKVESEDGKVSIAEDNGWRRGYGSYILRVPKSKQTGYKYFGDKELRKLVEKNEFETKGNSMVANVSDENLPKVLDRLSKLGVTVLQESKLTEVDDNQNDALILQRGGNGALTDDELSYENDPVAKMTGRSPRTAAQRRAFAERERQRMVQRVQELTKKLHLDNVDIVTDASTLQGNRAKAKGFYSRSTGRITIVIPNQTSVFDAEQTLLHEAVAHYGLRELFGEHFDTFLDNVFQNAEKGIQERIAQIEERLYQADIEERTKRKGGGVFARAEAVTEANTKRRNGDYRKAATEEYLASLAESTNFDNMNASWWQKIKELFLRMLHKIGFEDFSGVTLSDNELRYILWRSYENLAEPGRYRSILGEAEDVAKQNELKVGNYAPAETATSNAAEASKNTDSGEDLFRDNEDDASAIYEKGVANTFWHRFSEGWYDYLRSVRVLQDALQKAMGRKLDDFENVLLNALHKTSVDKAQWDKLKKNYIDPLANSLAKVVDGKKTFRGKKLTQDDVEIYLNCKHGLERNDKFAMRDAEQMRDERIKKADDELSKAERDARNAMERAIRRADKQLHDGEIDNVKYDQLINDAKDEYDESIAEANDAHEKAVKKAESNVTKDYQKNRERDYSGLTEIFDPEGEAGYTNAELEDLAKQYVADMEQTVPKQELDELWDKIHKINAYSLKKSYESGLISKQTYESTKDMFDYYVPLRGFEKETANDVYDYITESDIPIEQVMKHAKGRTSRATNLIATMMNMAHSSIVSGNRNLVKQKLLNLALNADNDLLTVGNQWYEDDGMGGWIPVQEPPIRDGMTAKEAREVVEQFEENMKEREKNGEVRRMRKGVSLPIRIVGKRAENEHGVRVKRNGQEYVVWINGNPKAAQAINGILNPETERGWVLDHIHKLNRFVSKNVTSLRPNFLLSNLKRDILSSNMVGFVKYGIKYTRMFDKFVKDNLSIVDVKGAKAGKMRGIYALYHRYNNGTLDLNDKRDRYFKEFMENGGETGYSQMWSIDDYEKQIRRTLNKDTAKEKFRNGWQAVGDAVEFANRGIENVCRFAAYMASRESGMSVLQSIADAKEASVNFNRKGSGAMGNNAARAVFMFLNPAIQGFMQHNKLLMKYPKRMLAIDGGLIALGVIVGLVNSLIWGGGDDDDDKETENDYFNINPFVRRNNIVLRMGRHEYAKIDLPQELRPWYGLGEIAYAAMTGHMKHDNVGVELFSQLTQTIPLNPITGNALLSPDEPIGANVARNILGSMATGSITDAFVFDKDYAGNKITKASEYNKLDPEWKRAGRGTSSLMIGTTKMLNDLTGGNDYKKGWWDWNPSRWEHVATSMLGGRVEFFKQLWTTGQALVSGDEDERNNMRNYPFVSTSYINTDNSYNRNYRLNNEFDWYQHEFEQARHEYNGLKNDKKNVFEKAEEFDAFIQTPEYKIYRRFKKYDRRLKKQFEKLSDETDDDKRKKISDRITEIKKDAVEEMQRINK